MKFIDAHIHLTDPEYNGKISRVIQDARRVGVVAMISNGMDQQTSKQSLELAQEHPGLIYAALGIHPWNANQLAPSELTQITKYIIQNATNRSVSAIGEIGLDPQYAKRQQQKQTQDQVFQQMLQTAERTQLPVIIHSRWSAQKILETLSSYHLNGVLWHWLSTTTDLLQKITAQGHYISEGPPTVFSEKTQGIVKATPLENLLTETDGPVRYYGPYEGKTTTPALIPDVVKAIAEIKAVSQDTVAEQVANNFTKLFKITI